MRGLIKKVFDHCGYYEEPTEENLVKLFLEDVDAGVFANIDYDEAIEEIDEGTITLEQMCYNLLKVR